jgi:hypothetical protein
MAKTGAKIVNLTKQGLKNMRYIKELEDKNLALTNENKELEKITKDLRNRFIKGGVNYIENKDGYVIGAVKIFEYSEYTFDQIIHEAIGTPKYNIIPFIKAVDRQLEIDITKKRIYDSI